MEPVDNPTTILTQWVHEYSDGLFSWALHKTSDQAIAEDIVQETFIAAHKNFDSFEGKSSPKTWLTSILNNKIKDHYRAQSRKVETVSIEWPMPFTSDGHWKVNGLESKWTESPELLDELEFIRTFEKCIDALPDHWGFAVRSRYVMSKKSKDICQELDITESNYWQIIHRAKLSLKSCLELNWFSK